MALSKSHGWEWFERISQLCFALLKVIRESRVLRIRLTGDVVAMIAAGSRIPIRLSHIGIVVFINILVMIS